MHNLLWVHMHKSITFIRLGVSAVSQLKIKLLLSEILTDVPEEGELRLYYNTYSFNYYRGLLQVWINGRWGVVSDSSWSFDDTNTVCRQLGRNGKVHRPALCIQEHYLSIKYRHWNNRLLL